MHCSYLIFVAIRPLIIKQGAMLANSLSRRGLLLFSKSEVSLVLPNGCLTLIQCSGSLSDYERWQAK